MKKSFYFLLAGLFISSTQAGTITKTFNFYESDLSFFRYENYLIPKLIDRNYKLPTTCEYTNEVGNPYLPIGLYTVLVPANSKVTSVSIVNSERIEIAGEFDILPTPQPQPFSLSTGKPIIIPNDDVYSNSQPYPAKLIDFGNTGDKSGFRLCPIVIYPLQYFPAEKRLLLYKKITIQINYQEHFTEPTFLTPKQKTIFEKEIKSIVINPEDINRFAPTVTRKLRECEYLVITTETLSSSLQPLVNWRTKQGFKAEITTVSHLTASYPGRDVPEKIRNGIIDYYRNRGLIFVVLAGDSQLVQPRLARVVASSYTGNIPSDLYFSDLNGSWDGNRNNIFGEVPGDSIDMYPDVYVGRASIDNVTEGNTFVNKVLTYEKNPVTDYLKKVLLPSVPLFTNYHGRIVNDTIATITPVGWFDANMIDPSGTTPMRDSINNGFHFCHISAHGSETGVGYQNGSLIYNNSAASSQTNGNRLVIVNSIACNAGDFGYGPSDCLAEIIANNPNGGGVAVIMNSRYGWGSPPNFGPSERMDIKFYDFLFNADSFLIGIAHTRSKSIFTSYGLSDAVWRWCIYALNLFGDPAMPMWTEVPQNMICQFPQVVPLGPSNFSVQVNNTSGMPVSRALVSLQKGNEIYVQSYTNNSGFAQIPITPLTPGRLYLTITAHNCYPFEDSILVQSSGAYVSYLRSIINDSIGGNGDGIPNPGEMINLRTWVKNWGNILASNVIGKLRTNSTSATIQDSVKTFGNIPANDSAFTGINGYIFTIAPSCTNAQQVPFRLYCQDALDSIWISYINLRIGTPVLTIKDKIINDQTTGNNNARLDPGETANLLLILRNQGLGNGYNVQATLRSMDSRLVVLDSFGEFGTIYHETTGVNVTNPFTIYASFTISPGTLIPCSLKIMADNNYQRTVGFNIVVGEFRPVDPIPDGPRIPPLYWAYDNTDSLYSERPIYNWIEIKNIGTRLLFDHNDQVRIVELPNTFGTIKFYGQRYNAISVSVDGFIRLGADTTRDYTNSPIPDPDGPAPMIAVNWDDLYHSNTGIGGVYVGYIINPYPPCAMIIEWDSLYYYQATSVRDKFQVIILDSTVTTPTGDNVIIFQYMTANRYTSSTIGIEDPTETIGIQYLLDGMYHPASAGIVPGRAIKFTTSAPMTGNNENYPNMTIINKIFANRPNPFKTQTQIQYSLSKDSKVSLQIFDVSGRLIRTLINRHQTTGIYTVNWDAKNEQGEKVSQGIYFCNLKTETDNSIRKLIVVE
ncbi:MAG: C25 family cysteine peptidase [candidate division WOR-3 bacterium]|nr:C25 family cysteine peptidase [candidate division WOR-3 bacterium]